MSVRHALPLLIALLSAASSHAATLTVTTTSTLDGNDGACSLTEAITAINQAANHRECAGTAYGSNDRIEFNIPGDGVRTILMSTTFPAIVRPVTIDGLSQPGASCDAWPPTLRIELDGQGGVFRGLHLAAGSSGSLVRGLVIGGMANSGDNFSAGILLLSNNNRVECNYIGMRADGSTANPNRRGIDINSASDNIIGTDGIQPALGRRNLVSGNLFSGINMRGNEPSRNVVAGNYVGVDASGSAARSNGTGITVNAASNSPGPALDNVIGYNGVGSPEFARNIISGNTGQSTDAGIAMVVNVRRTRIAGNYIGLSADGTTAIPNRNGIQIGSNASVQDNLIGYPSDQPLAVSGNVISGNEFAGIAINGFNGTDRTFILGNLIGTFPNGAPGLPNGQYGVQLFADTRALVNGNVISGHAQGIRLLGASGRTVPRFLNGEALPTGGDPLDSTNNCITGNATGAALVPNGGNAAAISFLGNWWGAANGPAGAGGGSGDAISAGIGFDPFLASAPAGCAVTEVADLQVVVQDVPSPLVAGTGFVATLGATNAGPDDVASASLSFTLPPGFSPDVPPLCALDAGQIVCPLGPIASGQTVSAPASFDLPPDASGNLVTTVSVTSPTLDPAAGNNSEIVNRSIVREVDLQVALALDTETVEGATAQWTLRVENAGPSQSDAAEVLGDFGVGLAGLSWTCAGEDGASCGASGSDVLADHALLPPGGAVVYSVNGTVADIDQFEALVGGFPEAGVTELAAIDNEAALSATVLRRHDLRVALETEASAAEEGQPLNFRLRVGNDGPSRAAGAGVLLQLDPALGELVWTCSGTDGATCAASGSGTLEELADLPAGSEVVYEASVLVGFALDVGLQASVAAAAGSEDPVVGNDSAGLQFDVVPLPREPDVFRNGFEPLPPAL